MFKTGYLFLNLLKLLVKKLDQSLVLGLVLGIVILWLGIIVILVSYPLTKGTIDPRKYNYRPWQPKFVKELTDAKAKELGKRDGKLGVNLGILMILIGIASFILGLAGQGFYTLYLLNIFVIVVLLLIFYVYARAYKDSKGKA